MSEAGIGVDIVEISRMERILKRTPAFARRVFTDEERAYCDGLARPAVHYACRFAAREAVLKALGVGFSEGVGFKDVFVSRDERGRPHAVLTGRALELAQARGIVEVALSLSHTNDLAIANAMTITAQARPRPKERPNDERAELAKSFKEARGILDELDQAQENELRSLASETNIEHGGTHETSSEL